MDFSLSSPFGFEEWCHASAKPPSNSTPFGVGSDRYIGANYFNGAKPPSGRWAGNEDDDEDEEGKKGLVHGPDCDNRDKERRLGAINIKTFAQRRSLTALSADPFGLPFSAFVSKVSFFEPSLSIA